MHYKQAQYSTVYYPITLPTSPIFSTAHSSRLSATLSTEITHYRYQCLHVFTSNSSISVIIFTDFSAALDHPVLWESLAVLALSYYTLLVFSSVLALFSLETPILKSLSVWSWDSTSLSIPVVPHVEHKSHGGWEGGLDF